MGYAEVKANGVPNVPIFANLQNIEHWRGVLTDGDSGGPLAQDMTHTKRYKNVSHFVSFCGPKM
ncbi:hypothetical protein [Fundidesulfovibrio putealis]|uniref:hypothetical protein n=1 Tax=Fundidesulfovibrio putealis TaxID=270496 RepID=UPI00146FA3E6|nr:hypothetical protein [Fundidesulfovibrio putealis]